MVSQKMKASASKKGFTLVELIVVITILAILGTIGFISIQGYSSQSRDAKRTSDLRSLASAITIKATDGMTLTSFVSPVDERTLTGTGHIGGKTFTNMSGSEYTAGSPNFTALGVNASNFVDGANQYAIATSTRNGGVFQIAATLEAGGTKTPLLTGNYSSRAGTAFAATYATGSTANKVTVTGLTGSGVGYFMKGDILTSGSVTLTIDSVNGDGTGFAATSNAGTPAVGSTVALNGGAEATGIMAATAVVAGAPALTAKQTPVGGTNLPY